MNHDEVKEKLLKLRDCKEEYTVLFSGNKSKRVNGLYDPNHRDIIIHNQNFNRDEAGNHALFYTAMHELAHHIQYTENHKGKTKGHTQGFYAILDDLVDKAEELGIYAMPISPATQDLIDEARSISQEIAALQKRLGRIMIDLQSRCDEEGIRMEDVAARKIQMSKKTLERSVQAHNLNVPDEVGIDIQNAAITARDAETREAIVQAGMDGQSVAQAKRATAFAAPAEEDETLSLVKEKRRLERSIEHLTRRLEAVEEQLESRGDYESEH